MSLDASPALLAQLAARADTRGWVRFDAFMDVALYSPGEGYYTRRAQRVGREGADFFTATSLGPIFGELICAAVVSLVGEEVASRSTFVEIGVEPRSDGSPGAGVLEGLEAPFAAHRTVPVGSEFSLEGSCIVFSNELFDAQPCRRFLRKDGVWLERWVALENDSLTERLAPVADKLEPLAHDAPEGYTLDLPLASVEICRALARQPWTGLFVAADYGKSWAELSQHTPQGTVRAYHQHRQSNDLLAQPGRQDLTCHVCWDWLVDALQSAGFANATVESQEAFLVRHAGSTLSRIMQTEAHHVSPRKLALMQLLHPAAMGQKFQFLHALRRNVSLGNFP